MLFFSVSAGETPELVSGLSPSFLRFSSFVAFCCAVTFSAVEPLPGFSLSDSLLMTEPSSLGNLLQVTIATREAVSFPEAGLPARLCHLNSPPLSSFKPKSRHNRVLLNAFTKPKVFCLFSLKKKNICKKIRVEIRETSFLPLLCELH